MKKIFKYRMRALFLLSKADETRRIKKNIKEAEKLEEKAAFYIQLANKLKRNYV